MNGMDTGYLSTGIGQLSGLLLGWWNLLWWLIRGFEEET
jgi:hypothetical protein